MDSSKGGSVSVMTVFLAILFTVVMTLAAFAVWSRLEKYGCIFMPESAAVSEDSETRFFVDRSDGGRMCLVFAGARLVRVNREDGYVLVRVENSPQHTNQTKQYADECPDGMLTVMSDGDFWSYVSKFKSDSDSLSKDREVREIKRRLLKGK